MRKGRKGEIAAFRKTSALHLSSSIAISPTGEVIPGGELPDLSKNPTGENWETTKRHHGEWKNET